jgi:hypothetical protein
MRKLIELRLAFNMMRRLRRNPNLFEGLLMKGFKGYRNYTLNELENETNETFGKYEL